jgi:hypothetical protein
MQGEISAFGGSSNDDNVDLSYIITNQVTVNLTLISLAALTNFDGFVDLSDQVRGYTLMPGESLQVPVEALWDYTTRKRYTLLRQITASKESGSQLCF